MTSRSDVERMLDRYLAEGAEQVPDRVIDAALDHVDQIPQRRAFRVPWRSNEMPTFLKPASAAFAVLAVVVIGSMFLNRVPTNNTGGPPAATSSPSATASASTTPEPFASRAVTITADWVPFTSERYGYEIAHPPAWTATPSVRDWVFDTDRVNAVTDAADRFIDEGAQYKIGFSAFAVDVPPGTSQDDWITAYYEGSQGDGNQCDALIKEIQPIAVTVDGHEGRMWVNDACSDAQAFVFRDGRVHVFAVWRDRQQALLEAFLSTVRFAE